MRKEWRWLTAIWFLGIAAYSNTFSAPFVFDDLVEIVGNQALRNSDWLALAQRYPTRIVPYLTLAANYAVSGEEPTSYHLVNILIHLLTATAVFLLVRELAGITKYQAQKNFLAGACGLLFVSHPIQTQAVTYVIQRLSSLATLFYLLGLLIYVLARKRYTWNWLHIVAWLVLLLSMFSKEIAFTAPIATVMIEWFFFGEMGTEPEAAVLSARAASSPPASGPRLSSARRRQVLALTDRAGFASESHSQTAHRPQVFTIIPYLFLLLVIPVTLWLEAPPLLERGTVLVEHGAKQPGRQLAAETSSLTRREYFLTQVSVVRTYLRLLVLPVSQNLDYDYPISHSLFEVRTLGSLVLLLALLGFGVWLYPRNRLASFGIFFFFLTLSVESSFIPIRDVINEHRLYLPSVGFGLTAVTLAAAWLHKRIVRVGIFGIVLLFTSATWARNQVWESEIRLWSDVTQKSPQKARGHNNLGAAYVKKELWDSAEASFQRALETDPTYAEAFNNLGLLKAQHMKYEEAIQLFKQAVALEPFYAHALNNLGVVYLQQGNVPEAVTYLEAAVGTDRFYLDAKMNLAVAYLRLQEFAKAREQLEVALQQSPDHDQARRLLLTL